MKIKRVRLIYFSCNPIPHRRLCGESERSCPNVSMFRCRRTILLCPRRGNRTFSANRRNWRLSACRSMPGRVPNKLLPYVRDAIHGSDTLAFRLSYMAIGIMTMP